MAGFVEMKAIFDESERMIAARLAAFNLKPGEGGKFSADAQAYADGVRDAIKMVLKRNASSLSWQ